MKTKRITQIVDAMDNGEKLTIEKRDNTTMFTLELNKNEDSTFWKEIADLMDERSSGWDMRGCGAAYDENINKHGVDLSIFNQHDWFKVKTAYSSFLYKGTREAGLSYSTKSGVLYYNVGAIEEGEDITFFCKATPEDLAPFFEKYPMYAPVKVGDIGIFYDYLEEEIEEIAKGAIPIGLLTQINSNGTLVCSDGLNWKHFFKVQPTETIAEIKERFLKENEL